jgi:hypothetical protein
MPRKSAAELTAPPAPQVPGQGRPEPPPHLDCWEEAIWRAVVAALPPFWLDGAAQLVLRRLVAQAALADRYEARMRRMRKLEQDVDSEVADDLAVRHAAIAKTVTYLLTALRGTPRSRELARQAAPEIVKVPAFRPWEQRADDDVDEAPSGMTQ